MVSKFLRVFATTLVLASAGSFILAPAFPDVAFAKGGKDKDKGSKDKSSKNKSSKSDRSSRGKNKADKPSRKVTKQAPKAKPKVTKAPKPKAVKTAVVETTVQETEEVAKKKNINSALGALNAANASATAMENASPNSRVGRIAAYRDQVLSNEELGEDIKAAELLLATQDAPDLTREEYLVAIAESESRKTALETEIREIETALNAVGGINAELEEALEQAKADLAAENEASSEFADVASYYDAEDAIAMSKEQLEEQKLIATELLENAANKPITDDVINEVHRLLNLPPVPEEEIDLSEVVTE